MQKNGGASVSFPGSGVSRPPRGPLLMRLHLFSATQLSAKTNAPAVKDFNAIEPRDQKSTHTVEHGGARNGYCCELIG